MRTHVIMGVYPILNYQIPVLSYRRRETRSHQNGHTKSITMNRYLGPNTPLIGIEGGCAKLSTPVLTLDLTSTKRNIQTMLAHCQTTDQKLRPHGKSHKCSTIARWQIEAGAVGICCATIREAEIMVDNGIPDVLITSPVTTEAKIGRLIELDQRAKNLIAVVDNALTVTAIEDKCDQAGHRYPLALLVDFDIGLHRTGTKNIPMARELARLISNSAHLRFMGVQAYAGHLQHIQSFDKRLKEMASQAERIQELIFGLRADGLGPNIVTGGGTGTSDIDHRFDLFTELQAGSYVFTDVQYNAVQLNPESMQLFEPSLMVQASVVSTSHDSHAVIDAGFKSFATDGPPPEIFAGAPSGAEYKFMGDEHGAIVYPKGVNDRLKVGDMVSCIVPHCDPTVNLYDHYHCVQDNRLIEILPIDARGNP